MGNGIRSLPRYQHGGLHTPDLLAAIEEWERDPQAARVEAHRRRAMAGERGYASIGPTPSWAERVAAQVRSVPRRIDRVLQPETSGETAALVGASLIPGVGESIDIADIVAGARTGDLPRMGWGALGFALPLVAGSTLRKIAQPTRFTTARGSRYKTGPEGVSERMRIDEKGIRTLQPPSQRTYYMTPENADRLGLAIQGQQPHVMATHPNIPGMVGVKTADPKGAGKWNIGTTSLHPEGNYADFLARNKLVDSPENIGRYMQEGMVPYVTEPEVGLIPVESWIDPDLSIPELIAEGKRRRGNTAHFGSPIDRVLREGDEW